ncbi:MAG: PQQ-dependent sugar dehydrogenase [Candidatus Accumulibacter sp. UW25]|jgi:glucose/arabinose dehydrogenase
MQRAQRLDDHAGSVIRLHDDGRVPADNPFVAQPGALPEKFTIGNRNVQGAALHPRPANCGRTSTGRRAATRSTSSVPASTTAGR